MPLPERTHTQIWERIGSLELDVNTLTERLETTREVVLTNQREFKEKLDTMDRGMNHNTIIITRVDEKIGTGTKVITWMFGAGITMMGLGLAAIGYLA
jgi:hypothetical protein